MDAVRTYRELVRGSVGAAYAKRKFEPACSGVVLYLGLSKRYDHLLHHNFIFSRDPKEEFDAIYKRGEPAPDPTAYVCAPSSTEPSVALEGGEALYVLVHTPYLRPNHNWRSGDLYPHYRQVILDKLKSAAGLYDIKDRIVFERHLTPQDIHERYRVLNGAIYGLASHGRVMGAFKPGNRSRSSGVEDELVARLSGGYQRRAAIATALMGDAPLVILDEPTTGLDVEATEAISVIVRGLASMGTTIVIATHDFGLADATADCALFLKDGRLLAMDAPRNLCLQLFPGKKHVEIALSEEPSAQQVEVLLALNADRRSARRWSLFSSLDAQHQPTILQRLHNAGFEIQETLIREPGVAALFERFCLDRGAP